MKNILLFLFIILASYSCRKDENKQEIISDLIVQTEVSNENIIFNVSSEKMYGTTGYEIIYCEKLRKNKIYIHFKNIKVPDAGLTVISPAICKINLGNLDHGTYEVTFKSNNKKNKGHLYVDANVDLEIASDGNVKTN
ncbi:hypothetical protein CW751_03105 [Brumimicrobium salinarum]|uniref:Uncharacterized protein n=1 Tax=Brumimicrobium salinarum TaxID=2058658 RepID=A0A2I0R4Q8_9FLAO|nr:hypothetical protein [Brumimicrobium salinarum]PKR81529.1 hypothetical protein CW751_03105 [Brumimicrobium salinarum]